MTKLLSKDYVVVNTRDENRGRMGQIRVKLNGKVLVQFIQTERIWFDESEVSKWE